MSLVARSHVPTKRVGCVAGNAGAPANAAADSSLRPSVEEERAAMESTRLHAVEHGGNPKTGTEHGWVSSMRRKFERFLEKHGEEI